MTGADVYFEVPADIPEPVLARDMTPDWFKQLPALSQQAPESETGTKPVATARLCRPFVDAMELGVTIRSPYTIQFDNEDGTPTTVENGAGDNLTIYDAEQPETDGNSTFRFPNAVLDLPIRVTTADGFFSLFSTPFNKSLDGVEPFAFLIPSGEPPVTLSIPLLLDGSTPRIEAGDPIVDMLAFPKKTVLDSFTVQKLSDDSELRDRYHELRHLKESRGNDFYKMYYWDGKPSPEITQTESVDHRIPTQDRTSDSTLVQRTTKEAGGSFNFSTHDKWWGVIPEPTPAHVAIPPHFDEIGALIGGEKGERLQQWIQNAMRIGVLGRMPADVKFVQDGIDDIETRTPFSEQVLYNMSEELIRANPTGDVNMVNWNSQWVVSTPDGYSGLFLPPFNHHQQYIQAFFGIVENDDYISTGNTPSRVLTSDYPVEINRGTAVFQYIPLKRDALDIDVEIVTTDVATF